MKRILLFLMILSIFLVGCGLTEEQEMEIRKDFNKYGFSKEAQDYLIKQGSYTKAKKYIDYYEDNILRMTGYRISCIVLNKITTGMNKEDVKMAWGNPDSKYTSFNMSTWIYEYSTDYSYKSTTLYFYNGILDHWDDFES